VKKHDNVYLRGRAFIESARGSLFRRSFVSFLCFLAFLNSFFAFLLGLSLFVSFTGFAIFSSSR
jgi:hypothetical protein